MLEAETCGRARRSRDARFDGRFWVGVVTTGVYCRPVCSARMPKEENVRYFASAAAAAESGFRPCLRCRPELAPGTPAANGTEATVSRALRLISGGALDGGGIESLTDRLGIGGRHLRRLFLQHLGATPVAVAQARRLHFAKQLIDETDLPFIEVAAAAGFGSVRRFNAVFEGSYGRTPTGLRRLAQGRHDNPGHGYRFRLRFRQPLDWRALLDFLKPRAIPGVEAVDGESYRRTIALEGRSGWMDARLGDGCIELAVEFAEPRALFQIVERARRLFDLASDPREIEAHLAADPLLAPVVRARPGLRVPGAWDAFETAVRAILGQQITVKGASTLAGRLAEAFGTPVPAGEKLTHIFPSPQALASADLGRIGLPAARAECIRELASAVVRDELWLAAGADPAAVTSTLTGIRGIGQWTAQYIVMRSLGEPDGFPAGDLSLRRKAGLASAKELEERAERWRPWRAYAAMYLWQGVAK